MAFRFYLVPVASVVSNGVTYKAPAYMFERHVTPTGLNVPWGWMPWGRDDRGLLLADVNNTQHTTLNGQPGVTFLFTLATIDDVAASATRTRATTFATNVGLPTSWITASITNRELLKTFAGIALVLQRFNGRAKAGVQGKLGDTVGSLTAAQRDHLIDLADDFSPPLVRGSITASSTIGDLLIAWGQQFIPRPLTLAGQTI